MKLSVTARDQTCCLVHHFGQEEEESLRQLFVELVRNLYLGQWEIASACHEHLCKQRKHHGKSVHLQTLLCDHCVKIPQAYSSTTGRSTISPNEGNSLGISIGSRSVPSPHHLSWLCLMNLKKTGFEMTQYGDAVQFRLMLEQTHECEPSAAIIKEIYDCYSSLHGVSAATNASPSRLSEESLSLIERIIDRDIILGHQIICRLTAQQTQVVHNAALQHVYLRCMRRHLALINRAQTGISGDSAAVNPSFSFVCKLLSLLNAEVARSCSEPVCELFEEVLDATERVGESSLAHRPIADDVCAALLRVDDSFLVDEYLKLEDERFGRCPAQRARTTTELTRRSSGEDYPNVASASLVSWREIFLSCLRGKTHFLEDVLLNCLESVLRHDYEALRHFLAPPAFSRLRPLVVLLSWRMCDDVSNLTKLIKTIWPPDETPPLTDASLQRGVDRLSNELEVINWCMSKIRTSKLPVATDTYQRAQNLLHCMEDNSVLYVLHYMGMIGRVPHRDIYELLREKRASVTMAEADAGVSIYSAFCAVQAVMDAIFHSTAIEHKIQAEFRRSRRNSENCKSDLCKSVSHESRLRSQQDCERTRSACVGIDTSGSKVRYDEMDMQAQARDEYQQLYTKHVMMALQCARSAITAVNPLAYRLETLENIFSLLFVRYKDLHDSVLPPGDATEEGGNGDEERSRRSFETSLDSIVFEQHLSVSEKQAAPATLTVEQHRQVNSSDSTGEHTATTSADVHAGPGGGGGATDQCFLPLNDERSSEGDCQWAPYVGYSSSRSVSSLNGYSTGFLCNALLARDLLHLLKDCVDELKVTETTRSQQPAPSRPSERERPQAPTKPELVTNSERAPPQAPTKPELVTDSERAPLQEPNEPAFVTHSERAPPQEPNKPALVTDSERAPLQEPNEPALFTHSEGAPPQMRSESALDAGMKTASRDVIGPTLSTPLKDSTLQARLSCLSRLVSEALWRYRLVTDSGTPDAVGVISISEPRLERSDDGEEDEEAEEWTKPRYRRRHKHAGVINAHSSSSASKSASQDGESQSGGQDGGRRTRRKSLRRQRGSHRNFQPRNSIVSEMLASRETLLNVCLLKGNYLQAKQVIKMCDMDEHPAVYEVGFLEHQEMAARKIMNAEMRHKATQLQGDNYSGKDSVSSIARVAASGLAVTLISRVAEELLHHSTPCVSLTHHQAAALLSLGVFRAGEEPAMVVADLGVASSGTHDGSLRLLDLATRKLSAAGSLQTSGGGGGGGATFSGFLARLVALGGALDGRRSVAHALTCGTFSPHAEMRRHQVAVVDGLQQWGRAALACLHRGVATRRGGEPSDDARSLQRPGKQLFRRFRRTRHQVDERPHGEDDAPSMEVVVTTMVKLLANAQLSFDHRADSVAASFPVPLLSHAWSNLHSLTELVKEAQEAGSLNVVDQLETGPTYTLGRLLLQGRLPPDRLEEAAHNLGLDLMTIIVQSCCPLVPTGGVASIEGAVDDAEVIVLNEGEFQSISRSPTLIVEEILTQLIHLVKDYISLDGATISLHSCQKIAASAGFAIIVVATSELASVDLDLLASDEEKLCFWVNVFNLMFVHTMLWAAVHNKCLPLLDETSVAAMLYLQTIRYTVGQINLVSLFDVRYFILRRGLPAPHSGLLAHRLHPLQESDPWWKHTAPSVDARVQFVLLTGSLFHSPPLQVIRQVMLEEQLKLATRQFLEHRICIDAARKQVFVPPSLHLFAADMAPAASMDATPDATVTGDRWHATQLLHFMGLYCPDLQQLLNKGKKSDGRLRVSALSVTPEPGLTLAYPPSSGATSPRGHRRITSLPIRMGGAVSLGDEPAAGARIPPVFRAPPTEAALAFTSEKSRLLGTVLRLFARAAGNDVPDVASEFPRLSAFLEAAVWPVLDVVTPRHRQDVLAVLLSRSAQSNAVRFLVKAMSPAISDGRGEAVLHAISCLPHTTQRSHQLRLISDHLLCGAIWEQTRLRTAAAERGEDASAWSPWQRLTAVYDGDAKRRCALGCMEHWPVEACVCALQTCCDDPPRSATLHEAITQKLGEMKVYQKVMECAVLCHGNARPVQGECTTELATYEYWIFTDSMSRSQPTVILNILLKCHEYSVAREWASMHDATHELRQRIEEAHITYLLDSQNDLFKAYKVLADIENKRLCLGACLLLMEQLSSLTHVMSVCQFVLCCLGDELTDTERTKLQRIKLGIKALLLLPEQLCEEYQELISRPDLLIEQLLMNFKVEYVASVYKEIQGAAPDSSLTSLGCGQEWFNTLVLHYAFKALEFPFRGSPQSVARSPEHTKFSGEGMSGGRTAGVMRQSLSAESLCLSVHHHRHGLSGRYSRLLRQRSISIGQFVIPLEPPLMEAWTADADVTHCMVCRIEKFSMFNRRHHCRRCGRVICRACSRHRRHVKGYGAILVRICDECHELMESGRSDERHHDVERLRSSLSGNGGGGGAAASIPASRVAAPASTGSSLTNSTTTLVSGWRMSSTSEEENESIRAQFYYEQAPSSNLCISVLDLHSNLAVGASYLLKLCDDLSKLLLPIEPGLHNPELDYNLIISMMRTLLMSAKMKLAEAEEEDDGGGGARPELCDTYLSRVDLLQLLVAANCQDVPSLQQLTKPDSARRYRDKLLEDERFQLAMEVSAKCSLDMNAVWTNWGMTHLRARDYANARSKLSKCLKKPIDMNQSSPQLVQDIVSALQTADSIPDLLSSATISCNDLIADPTQMGVGSNVDAYDESLYYLRAYGTHLSLLTFYVSHGHVHEALQCLLVHDCAVDVFIEGVLAPCTEKGQLPKLLQQMESLDASLQQWCRYLKAACRYLDQRHLLHTLYDLQMFMKDYVRAAMTGIRFYRTGGGVSYAQLHERLPHLLLAAQHLEMFLREQKGHRGSGGDNTKKRVPPDDDLRLWLSPNDVHSHLMTITLQIEVTKFLHRCEQLQKGARGGVGSPPPHGRDSTPPTLFGNVKVKMDVTVMVMLAGQSIDDGFGIAFRIIQEFRLNSAPIYAQVGRRLASVHRYREVRQLLACVRDSGLSDQQTHDEVVNSCLRVAASQPDEARETESLIKTLKTDANKVNAYIQCGKLKSAYLIAVRGERLEDIERISDAAEKAGQSAVKNICDKWLAAHRTPPGPTHKS